jgi:putative hydroxymethylpyrimidine transport system substrate-binding protein
VLAGLAAGCDSDDDQSEARPVSAVIGLDFTPNAVHAPIYMAVRNGYDRRHGVDLRIRPPGSSPDSLKLLSSGRADVAVLDIHDLGLARERGADVVGLAALVQRPLAAIIAQPGVRRPRDLEADGSVCRGCRPTRRVLRAVVEGDGGTTTRSDRSRSGLPPCPA